MRVLLDHLTPPSQRGSDNTQWTPKTAGLYDLVSHCVAILFHGKASVRCYPKAATDYEVRVEIPATTTRGISYDMNSSRVIITASHIEQQQQMWLQCSNRRASMMLVCEMETRSYDPQTACERKFSIWSSKQAHPATCCLPQPYGLRENTSRGEQAF